MTNYIPQYPILDYSTMKPRDQMVLVSEEKLSPLRRAELNNLRQGVVTYQHVIADTSENRENFMFTTLYYQQVAYKEGWEFKPEHWQVVFVPPGDTLLPSDGCERRVYHLKSIDSDNGPLKAQSKVGGLEYEGHTLPVSDKGNVGFLIEPNREYVRTVSPHESDGLMATVVDLFQKR